MRGNMAMKSEVDAESLYSKLKHQEEHLRLKQRWLMGLALSDSDFKRLKRDGIISTQHNGNNKKMPESFLRQDDVLYNTVKEFVEKGFLATIGGRDCHHVTQDDSEPFDFLIQITKNSSILDDMTNNGLHLVAQLLTGDSFKLEMTRGKMKKIIKQHLPQLLKKFNNNTENTRALKLCEILKKSQNFIQNVTKFSSPTCKELHAAALKILDGLEDMDSLTLSAMHRKLKGIKGYIPQLHPKKSGWLRSNLIDMIRKMSMQMLSELGEKDELQEPLAKAMAVATLSSNLLKNIPPTSNLVEFRKFSSEIIILQNEISKAISLLDVRGTVRFTELQKVQRFLDPNGKLSNRSLRPAVKNLLEDLLFECSDLDPIPEFLSKTLSIINETSRSDPCRILSEEKIEEDVENVLCLSAQLKQVSWDLLPEYKYDNDFAYAFIEDLEDSDNGGYYNDDISDDDAQVIFSKKSKSFNSIRYDLIEAVGETIPSLVLFNHFSMRVEPQLITETNLMEEDLLRNKKNESSKGNYYLEVQEACDRTSMVAYQFFGSLLEKFAQQEGFDFDSADTSYLRGENLSSNVDPAAKEDHISFEEADDASVILKVFDELLPSFPESGKEKIKELMGLK